MTLPEMTFFLFRLQVTLVAYVRVVPNAGIVEGELLTLTASVNIFSSLVTIDALTITVANLALFEDKAMVSKQIF